MTITVIDISSHQDPERFDYDTLCKNIDGVIIRAAYGTRILGVPGPDPTFERHYAEFSKRGVPIGAYHFICEWCTAKDQADLMSKTIKGKKFQLGIWADIENEKGEEPLSEKTVVDYMTLMEKLTGIKLDVYTGFYYWRSIMVSNPAKYADRKLWLSAYVSSPTPYIPPAWANWWMWQYTSHGKLAGYNSDLDCSYFYGDQAAFNTWLGKQPPVVEVPEPEPEPTPVTKTIELKTVVSLKGLKIRKTPTTQASNETGIVLPYGKVVEILETVTVGSDVWARVGQGQWSALKYGGQEYLR